MLKLHFVNKYIIDKKIEISNILFHKISIEIDYLNSLIFSILLRQLKETKAIEIAKI